MNTAKFCGCKLSGVQLYILCWFMKENRWYFQTRHSNIFLITEKWNIQPRKWNMIFRTCLPMSVFNWRGTGKFIYGKLNWKFYSLIRCDQKFTLYYVKYFVVELVRYFHISSNLVYMNCALSRELLRILDCYFCPFKKKYPTCIFTSV